MPTVSCIDERSAENKPFVVIAGNPNAGKTTLFNALTHSRMRTGNFHGVTCSPAIKSFKGVTYADIPGMYAFNGYTMEEASAAETVQKADLIVDVVDATSLEQSLILTKKLIELNPRTVVYLTKLSALKRRGGRVDEALLSKMLGVPVINGRAKALQGLIAGGDFAFTSPQNIALDKAYYGGNCKISGVEKLFYNKFFALGVFCLALIFTFFITFSPNMLGAFLKAKAEALFIAMPTSYFLSVTTNPPLQSFMCEGVVAGVGGVLSFVPQITMLYLMLILLDESGLSSVLSFVTDGLFERVGLSGRAAFSLVSGFGCTAAAISTTRGFTRESARNKVVAVLPFVPCGAKTPLFLTLLSPLFKNPFPAICILYFCGLLLAVAASAFFKRESEGLISEVATLGFPSPNIVFKKLFFQLQSFIIKVISYVFAFCVISWLLTHFGIRGYCSVGESFGGMISRVVCYLFYPMGVTDWRLAYAALSGFAAKENVAATIASLMPEGLNLGSAPTAALCVFFLCCPACVSAFAASVKEVGLKRTTIYNFAQLTFAFLAGYATYFCLL